MVDILKWFLGIFFGLFILWVVTGGPERAEKKNLTPTIQGPSDTGSFKVPSVKGN